MSFARKAAKGGLWLAGFRLVIQAFSWAITIAVARILSPADYGLSAMASILTGYIEIFGELGLGAAIIQKKEITQEEMSSIFWFTMIIGGVFAASSFGLAYPTAWIFREPRVIPITKLISVLFIVGAVGIVPSNILTRDAKFKQIGMNQFIAVGISSPAMLVMAHAGLGVWTLIWGVIIQRGVYAALTIRAARWRPMLHFRFAETKQLLKFGLNVAGARSLFYIFQRADRLIIGRLLGAVYLGFYSFAINLANMPSNKIVAVINQVLFPVFSRYQDDKRKCAQMYLKTTRYTALLVMPILLGGAFFGQDIIPVILGAKWMPMVFVFRVLCVAELVVSLTRLNNAVHNAWGKPGQVTLFQLVNTVVMPASIYLAAKRGFDWVTIPWVTIYPALALWWTLFTLRKLGISKLSYLKNIYAPVAGAAVMIIFVKISNLLSQGAHLMANNLRNLLIEDILAGACFYALYLFVVEKRVIAEIWDLRN